MELLAAAGRTLGFSLAAGVNLYATVAMLGLAARFDLVELPAAVRRLRQHLDHRRGAGVLYAVEFVADKVPWIDSLWDTVHTLVRPLGGALVAVATLGDGIARGCRGWSRCWAAPWPPAAT